jgi:hypothetical protein
MADYFKNKGDSTLVPHLLGSNIRNVTTAGTRVQLTTTSTPILSVVIKARSGITGTIYVGNNAVASTNGFAIAVGESVSIEIDDLSKVWIDSSVSGEGVTYLYVTTA